MFGRSLAFVWPASQSPLYGELNRLADDGLIEVSNEGQRGAGSPVEQRGWDQQLGPARGRRRSPCIPPSTARAIPVVALDVGEAR